MASANFSFISDAAGGDQFTVVSFSGFEAISNLYRYELEIKAPLSAAIKLDDVLDNPVRFVSELEGEENPVYGVLSSIDEVKTVQNYVHYRAVLVPRLWWLSIYKTNEIFTSEKTVDAIIQVVLENAGFSSGDDFDLGGLVTDHFINRDYRCQFGESDFDFLARLMENEGIFFYFDHSGDVEKIVFVNDSNYVEIPRPELIFDVETQSRRQHDCIHAWSCRKQRLPAGITVRDFNPDQPSLDISNTMAIDQMGQGTEYLYGENISDESEASYLSEIRAEERLCNKTRYYGESSVTRLQAGYAFGFDQHPNEDYNGLQYLVVEVNHEGQHLDVELTGGPGKKDRSKSQYRNSFVAIETSVQFRPARVTPSPRFYGTMTAFVYAEATGGVAAEVDEQGRYRVHLPFDRADGTKDSSDPHRKASTWIRMAQPYAGENEGMCFPLKGGTEVLLTFLNGDPDRPIISAALANASEPSLLNDHNAHVASISTLGGISMKAKSGTYSFKSSPVMTAADQASASWNFATSKRQGKRAYDYFKSLDEAAEAADAAEDLARVNLYGPDEQNSYHVDEGDNYLFFDQPMPSTAANFPFSKLNDFGQADTADLANLRITLDEEENDGAHIDRTTGPTYVHKSGSTFPYPEQERVYFFGTFHEDFHMDDMGISGYKRIRDPDTGLIDFTQDPIAKEATDPGGSDPEVFHFPAPGLNGEQSDPLNFPENRPRGVSEDKRWGDQMFYAWGRVFTWSGGPELGDGGAFGAYNYGNGYTENLIQEQGYTLGWASQGSNIDSITDSDQKTRFEEYIDHKDDWTSFVSGADHTIPWISSTVVGTAEDPPAALKDQRYIDPAAVAVDKTFGATYSYQMGYNVGIHEGASVSKKYGDDISYVEGNSYSNVDGDSYEHVTGHSHSFFHGDKWEYSIGSVDTEIKVAMDNSLYLANANSVVFGVAIDYFGGLKVDITQGWEIKAELAGELKKASARLKSIVTAIEKVEVAIVKSPITLTMSAVAAIKRRRIEANMIDTVKVDG